MITATPARHPAADVAFGPLLRAALPLRRELARDAAVWRWLAVGPLLPWLRHRWPLDGDVRRGRVDRYLGGAREHGLARIWWAAELSPSPEDAARLLASPHLLEGVLASGLARTPHVLGGLIDALADTEWEAARRAVKGVGIRATTVCLEALGRAEVAAMARAALDGSGGVR